MAEKTVLLVESSDKIRSMLSDPMEKVGYNILVAQWAEEALQLLQQHSIDAVVARDKLSGISSLEMLRQIRREPTMRIRPVVILYGKAGAEGAIQAFKAGADDYLLLPFSVPEMLYRVETRLRKTLKDEQAAVHGGSSALEEEFELPKLFPRTGVLNSQPVPALLGVLYQRGLTGILRVIQGKTIRSFCFEGGLITGAHSSSSRESLLKSFIRWRLVRSSQRKSAVIMSKESTDKLFATRYLQSVNASVDLLNGLAERHILPVLKKTLRKNEGDYDWTETKSTEGMLVSEVGLHPFLPVMQCLRGMFFRPDYSLFLPKPNLWIYPNSREGQLAETLRLTAAETAVFSLTAHGRTVGKLRSEASCLLPYADQLIYIAQCFNVLKTGEKRRVSTEEAHAVIPPKPQTKIPLEDLGKKETGEFQVVDLQPEDDEPVSPAPPSEPAPRKSAPPDFTVPHRPVSDSPEDLPSAPESATGADEEGGPAEPPVVKAAPQPAAKISSRPDPRAEPKPKPAEKPVRDRLKPPDPEEKSRKVRELYPDIKEEKIVTANPLSLEDLGFDTAQFKSGEFKRRHFAFVFAFCMTRELTGVTTIQRDGFSSKLFWRRGRLVFTRSDAPSLRLEQIMVDMGMITPEQKHKVELMIQEIGKMRSGTLIFKHQYVNMLQMMEALQKQMQMILMDVFNAEDGMYQIEECELPEDEYIPLDLPTASLMVESLRAVEDVSTLENLMPTLSDTLTQTHRAQQVYGQMKLGPVVIGIFDKFRKPAKVSSAIAGAEIPPKEFKSILLGLILMGLISYKK